MNDRRFARGLGFGASLIMAIALAGCAGGPAAPPVETTMIAPSAPPHFSSAGGLNVAYAEFQNSAFPYHGAMPDPDDPSSLRPFMNVNVDGKLGHQALRGGILWEDQTYNDRRVLLAASSDFNPNARSVIVVFFHGNHATLARDVVARQHAPRQIAESHLNAVLVAPQLAVDARDSSAGNFWREGGFAAFLGEAESKLADLYPQASRSTFSNMPVVIVAYSGGYLPAAFSLAHGGAGGRIRGVVLLDALYGEPDKFAQWVEQERSSAFFVSAYSASSKSENDAMRARLERDGVPTQTGVPGSLGPGTVAFVDAGDASHEDFVNFAWTADPLADVLARMNR